MFFLKTNLKKVQFLIPLSFFLMLIVIGCTRLDPDFGYRLKNGEFLFQEGLAFFEKTDPYSYTMPSYKFVEHAWSLALVIYLLFSKFGMVALSVLWSIVVFVSIYISLRTSENFLKKKTSFGSFSNFLVIFVEISLMTFFAVRVQVFSWLLMCFFLFWYFNKNLWSKFRYLVPLFFLIWANVHGSFLAGIVTYAFLVAIRSLNLQFPKNISIKAFLSILRRIKIKFEKAEVLILAISVLITWANPYGLRLWDHSLKEVGIGGLRWQIQEWLPLLVTMKFSHGLYLAVSLSVVIRERLKMKSERLYLYFMYLIQGILTTRHFPLYIFVSLPITIDAFSHFYDEVKNIRFAKKRLSFSMGILKIFSIIILLITFLIKSDGRFKIEPGGFYPVESVDYLKENLPEGEIFSLYGWGGYLNWMLPEKRVFVNGFMPVWSRNAAPENESLNAFRDYIRLMADKEDYIDIFEKYNVELVLLPRKLDPEGIDKLSEKLLNFYRTLFNKEEKKTFLERLREDGWEEIYVGASSLVLQKP